MWNPFRKLFRVSSKNKFVYGIRFLFALIACLAVVLVTLLSQIAEEGDHVARRAASKIQVDHDKPTITIFSILRDGLTVDVLEKVEKNQTLWLEGLHTRNALLSWTYLDVQILLFGSDEACQFVATFMPPHRAECRPIPCTHPEFGVPTYDCLYGAAANETADILVYSNSDMVYFSDFTDAIYTVYKKFDDFLMIGRRIDIMYPRFIDFDDPEWADKFKTIGRTYGVLHGEYGVDYFAYKKKYARVMPPFLVGRVRWDNWLVAQYIGKKSSYAIDSTRVVTAVHLNHMKIGQSGHRSGTDYNKDLSTSNSGAVDVKKIGDIFSTEFSLIPSDANLKYGACPECIFSKNEKKLDTVLYRIARDNNIIIATVNSGYIDFATNWYCSLKRVGLDNYLFHAADYDAKVGLEALGHPVYFYESEEDKAFAEKTGERSGENGYKYGSIAYQGLMNTRTTFIYKVLQKGYNVLLSDVDIIFLRNPFLFMNNSLDIQGGAHKDIKITGGFIYLRSTEAAIKVWVKVLTQHNELFKRIQETQTFDPHAETEQELLNTILLASTPNQVAWGRIPQEVLSDGKNFFIDRRIQKEGIWPAAIHNNYIVGKENKWQRFVNISMWMVNENMECKPFPSFLPPIPKTNQLQFVIKILAFDRPVSLKRLLRWLHRAEYLGDSIQLDIFIDYPATYEAEVEVHRKEVVNLARKFRWIHGKKNVVVRDQHYGLAGQWLNSWFPTSDSEIAIFIEDDNIVSPNYYVWLKEMFNRYYFDKENYDPRLYGIAMQHQHMIPGKYPTRPSELLPPGTQYYRYQQLSTWGPVFFPNHWAEFLTWYQDRSSSETFLPLFSNMITNKWFLNRGGGRSVWSAWFMRFAAEKGWYCIYTNFKDGAALVVNYRDKGVNYHKNQGPNSPMVESLENVSYPLKVDEMPLYDFHFNHIVENPSILEDRAIYSDIYNIDFH